MRQRRLPESVIIMQIKTGAGKEGYSEIGRERFDRLGQFNGTERDTDCSNQDVEQHNLRPEPATIETIPDCFFSERTKEFVTMTP